MRQRLWVSGMHGKSVWITYGCRRFSPAYFLEQNEGSDRRVGKNFVTLVGILYGSTCVRMDLYQAVCHGKPLRETLCDRLCECRDLRQSQALRWPNHGSNDSLAFCDRHAISDSLRLCNDPTVNSATVSGSVSSHTLNCATVSDTMAIL